jgi:hypothetical protein
LTPSRARELLLVVAGGRALTPEEGQALLEHYLRLEQRVEYLEAEIGERERMAALAARWNG